jgi:hypothetical protein
MHNMTIKTERAQDLDDHVYDLMRHPVRPQRH